MLARGDSVVATCRSPTTAAALQEVLTAHQAAAGGGSGDGGGNFGLALALDVSSEESVRAFPGLLESAGVRAIDVLVHNAGISAPTHPVDLCATANKAAMMACFETNAVGPLLLTQALLTQLRAVNTALIATRACLPTIRTAALCAGSASCSAQAAAVYLQLLSSCR